MEDAVKRVMVQAEASRRWREAHLPEQVLDVRAICDERDRAVDLLHRCAVLLNETLWAHADQDDGFGYNDCDKDPCNWCCEAMLILEAFKAMRKTNAKVRDRSGSGTPIQDQPTKLP